MNPTNQHLESIKEIRSIMERSSQFMSLSGLSGIFAGIVALLGAGSVYLYKYEFFFGRYNNGGVFIREGLISGSELTSFIIFSGVTAFVVLSLALSFGVIFTTRNAKRKQLPIWNSTARRMLVNLFIPLVTGGFFCLVLLMHGLIYLIAPATLIFYGLALVNASKYTLRDVRYLGLTEIVLGLLASLYVGYGLIFWAIGFGVLHIVYGFVMYMKYERADN